MAEIQFESSGCRLFAVEAGSGTPIILLHGGLANHEVFARFAPALYPRHRVITPDLRGSGRSHYRERLSWDQLADDVAALARHLGLARVAVGGISGGGGVAVRAALKHRELVSHLIALHPAYGGTNFGLTSIQQQGMAAMEAAGARAVAHGIESLFPLLDALPPEMREGAKKTFRTFDPQSLASTTTFLAHGGQPFKDRAELSTITCPTLVVPGVDPMHPLEVAEIYRAIPNAKFVEMQDFATAIDTFLNAAA